MIDKIKTRMASEEGFTLIELLVVIIILGILVAIAVPAYLSFAGNAKIAAAKVERPLGHPGGRELLPGHTAELRTGPYNSLTGAQLRKRGAWRLPNVAACLQRRQGLLHPGHGADGVIWNYIGGDPARCNRRHRHGRNDPEWDLPLRRRGVATAT